MPEPIHLDCLPENILRCLAPKDRPKGAAGMLRAEAEAAGEARHEVKDLHEPFRAWLQFHRLFYVYSRTDRKSTVREGLPDFIVIHGKSVCAIEFKRPGQKLRPAQIECRQELVTQGTPYLLAFDVKSAIDFIKETFDLQPANQ